ncbi:MAG: type II toxin-antitoxin system Phd/YefM family antitoxin [Planctomycetes bacterium]|nr:type II toxin-antitoxin system Phd/YefM family antitoxin [Planctomycetota bacterium]
MKFATVRDLKNKTSEMLRLAAKGKDVLVTSHGRPVAVLRGMSEEDLEDYILANHPALRASIEAADREYRKKGGIPLEEVIRRLEAKVKKGKQRG